MPHPNGRPPRPSLEIPRHPATSEPIRSGCPDSAVHREPRASCGASLALGSSPSRHPSLLGKDTRVTTDSELRADIRRLGTLLGQTLARQEGQALLDLVEEVRGLVRTDGAAAAQRLAEVDVATA